MLDRTMIRARGRVRSPGVAALAAGMLALAPMRASAGPAEALPNVEQDPVAPPETEPEVAELSPDERLARAKELYDRGRGKFETFDYVGAIELWTQAYTELPETEGFAHIRAKLMFNIAAARLSAFEIDDNIAHLRQARRLMDLYVDSLGETDDEEAADARAWQEKIAARLAEAEAERAKQQRSAKPRRNAPARTVATGPDAATVRTNRALTIAGAVSLSVGVAALGAMGGALAWGARLEARGRDRVDDDPGVPADDLSGVVGQGTTANRLAIGMGVVGGVLTAAGVGLLVTGLVRGRSTNGRQRAVVPVAGPGLVGVQARWRF